MGFVLLVFYLASFCLLFYFLGNFFIQKPLRWLSIPAAWVVIEFLKEIIWCGFGWNNLGYSQFRNLYLIQIADIGGTKMISFLIVLVNFLIWEGLSSCINKKKSYKVFLRNGFFILFILGAMSAYSFFRVQQVQANQGEKISISLIQPNVLARQLLAQREKEETIRDLTDLLRNTPEENLVIFPEAAWPFTLEEKGLSRLMSFAQDDKRDILIGVVNQREGKYYNSAFFINRRGLAQVYDKIVLVPFGEYVPLRMYLTFIDVLNQIGDITPGKEVKKFKYKGKSFSVLICFEDIIPLFTARAAEGRDFLVNITDDSWFGGNPQAFQHLSIMVLRAVENRIPIVRSANSGISGWVSPTGSVQKLKKDSKSLFVQAGGDFDIPTYSLRSFYNQKREWLVWFSFIFLAVVAWCKTGKE